jgi:hypothetical protein
MITRIESNCTTGEVKYFDENEVEITSSTIPVEPITAIEPIPVEETISVDAPTES